MEEVSLLSSKNDNGWYAFYPDLDQNDTSFFYCVEKSPSWKYKVLKRLHKNRIKLSPQLYKWIFNHSKYLYAFWRNAYQYNTVEEMVNHLTKQYIAESLILWSLCPNANIT